MDRSGRQLFVSRMMILAAALLIFWVMRSVAKPYLPEWARNVILIAFLLPMWWLYWRADFLIGLLQERPTEPEDRHWGAIIGRSGLIRFIFRVIIVAGILFMAWTMQTFSAPYLPEWAHYGLAILFLLPLWWLSWLSERAELLVSGIWKS